LQKTITWTKKFGTIRVAQGIYGFLSAPHKFKTSVKTWIVSRIILFQETLEFKHTLPSIMEVNSPQVWVVAQIVVDTLGLLIQ
jgi:hypothetical protein